MGIWAIFVFEYSSLNKIAKAIMMMAVGLMGRPAKERHTLVGLRNGEKMPIKVVFYYISPEKFPNIFYECGIAYNSDNSLAPRYSMYLANAMHMGIPATKNCDEVFIIINKIETGNIERFEYGYNDNIYEFSDKKVQVSITASDDWTYKPEGIFTLAEFKKTLLGWKKFLTMPQTLETRVTVDLEISGPDRSVIPIAHPYIHPKGINPVTE